MCLVLTFWPTLITVIISRLFLRKDDVMITLATCSLELINKNEKNCSWIPWHFFAIWPQHFSLFQTTLLFYPHASLSSWLFWLRAFWIFCWLKNVAKRLKPTLIICIWSSCILSPLLSLTGPVGQLFASCWGRQRLTPRGCIRISGTGISC